jgi:hypothetical protein
MHDPTRTETRGLSWKPRARVRTLVLGAVLLAAASARAGELEEAGGKLSDLEDRVKFIA